MKKDNHYYLNDAKFKIADSAGKVAFIKENLKPELIDSIVQRKTNEVIRELGDADTDLHKIK